VPGMAGEGRVIASAVVCRFGMRTVGLLGRMFVALLLRLREGLSGGGECGWVLRRMPSLGMIVCGRRRGIDAALSVGLHCAARALL